MSLHENIASTPTPLHAIEVARIGNDRQNIRAEHCRVDSPPADEAIVTLTPCFGLRHIRYFVVAAEVGSFRKAAAALSVRESAVSRRIRDLEDQIGASLFHRHSSGVTLTFAGERFLQRARKGLKAIHDGTRDVAKIGRGEEGTLRVGIFSSLASGFLWTLFRTFGDRHPGVRIDFVEGEPHSHIGAVRQLRVDVAFLTGTSLWDGCDTAHLWSERVFAVLPVSHPLTSKSEIDWRDLATSTFIVSDVAPGQEIHDYLVQRLADLGRHPEVQEQRVSRDNLLSLVALGRGLTVTSEAMTASHFPGIVFRPITAEILPFSAIWSPRNDNPALRRLLSLARSMATDLNQSHPSGESN
ncbi:TPA: LysR family transcriptional regulator [Pseudomonas aeruginosa]|uniref:HTH-type transcriptional regulator GltC n=2 Tax=Gammaproteobacteria TaxID=1236 RepID=A0A7S9H9J0_ACINO|nr:MULTISPECIES: LysR family transcriptional regulator [Gammaproteobacteria]EQL42692.1 hypothetical protein M770_35020 [Pseudomonas aeruginosa VRFPA03]HCB2577420.1 LysR family transcriptional regulator [Citrobacter freundii]AXV45955.1 HTH-type transcriptional regulator GltC [Pseudomonas aeruginosa]MBX6201885.1 LysR family transcriptional regulator [Pseudomonas aeruginosa]MBX6273018.1 LysR family transcriptional regulator [Pseudomonas aeruginosa]